MKSIQGWVAGWVPIDKQYDHLAFYRAMIHFKTRKEVRAYKIKTRQERQTDHKWVVCNADSSWMNACLVMIEGKKVVLGFGLIPWFNSKYDHAIMTHPMWNFVKPKKLRKPIHFFVMYDRGLKRQQISDAVKPYITKYLLRIHNMYSDPECSILTKEDVEHLFRLYRT